MANPNNPNISQGHQPAQGQPLQMSPQPSGGVPPPPQMAPQNSGAAPAPAPAPPQHPPPPQYQQPPQPQYQHPQPQYQHPQPQYQQQPLQPLQYQYQQYQQAPQYQQPVGQYQYGQPQYQQQPRQAGMPLPPGPPGYLQPAAGPPQPQAAAFAQQPGGPPAATPPLTGLWSSGLFDCFDDLPSCLITWFVPCISHGMVSTRTEGTGEGWFLQCCLFILAAQCCYAHLWACGTTRRANIRKKYGLPEDPCADCCVGCCCTPCALCQEWRELDRRGAPPAGGPF